MQSPGNTDGHPKSASAIAARNIDIIHEGLIITTDKSFNTVRFDITYYIRASKSGRQIPLIFYASEFREDFVVFLDGKPVGLIPINKALEKYPESSLNHFNKEDLKYFEVDITAGEHVVTVSYNADVTAYERSTVMTYGVSYDLWPAKNWKSFGTLTVEINNKSGYQLETNLGNPGAGNITKKALWKFNDIPADKLSITYEPQISFLAHAFIYLTPVLDVLLLVILIFLHRKSIKVHRRRSPYVKISWVVFAGGLLLPVFWVIGASLFSILERYLIGVHAGKGSGVYGAIFFAIFVYPILQVIYFIIMWLYDRKVAKAFRN
jgi:hypothetical protein